MDELDKFLEDNLLSKSNILRFIDDYSIYSYYIGTELELNTKYSSPLRQGDDDPSFSIFYSKYVDKIWFKDQALGVDGDAFDFVAALGKLSKKVALLQINSDFGLGLDGADVGEFKPHLVKSRPIRKSPVTIQVTNRIKPTKEYEEYWEFLEIKEEVLKLYFTTNPSIVHYIQDKNHVCIYPKELTIAYEILGMYKIYHPFADKKFKFRNNFKDIFVEGAMQLKFEKDFAIITKSTKEIMFMYQHFGWECVAGRSESNLISPHFMLEVLRKNYKTIFIWLDNDEAGILFQSKYLELYPWLIPIKVDDFIQYKDPTDLFSAGKKAGHRKSALKYIEQLIISKL